MVMRKLIQILVTGLIGVVLSVGLSVGVLAQQGNDNRPPKERPRVEEREKDRPPPRNNNQSNSNKPKKP